MAIHPDWVALWDFLRHLVVGALAFLLLAGLAVGLYFFIDYLESIGVSGYSIQIIEWLHYGIMGIDSLLLLAFLGQTGMTFLAGSSDE